MLGLACWQLPRRRSILPLSTGLWEDVEVTRILLTGRWVYQHLMVAVCLLYHTTQQNHRTYSAPKQESKTLEHCTCCHLTVTRGMHCIVGWAWANVDITTSVIGVANSGVKVGFGVIDMGQHYFSAFSSNLTACMNMCGCTYSSCYRNDHAALFSYVYRSQKWDSRLEYRRVRVPSLTTRSFRYSR